MPKLYDISRPIQEGMTIYPGDQEVVITHQSHTSSGDICTVSSITMSAHTGTHLDPPGHVISEGATIDSLAIGRFCGPAHVVEIKNVQKISSAHLENSVAKDALSSNMVLIKTDNSLSQNSEYSENYAALTLDGARWLIEQRVSLVGIDGISIDLADNFNLDVHRIFAEAEILVLEGLLLSHVKPGNYRLFAFPLNIVGGDGAPVRAVLEKADEE